MLRVKPDKIEQLGGQRIARLTLVNPEGREAFQLDIPLAMAQRLALELQGLAGDRCGDHHMSALIASSLGMKIGALRLSMHSGEWMSAQLMLEPRGDSGTTESTNADVDVAAGLALAIHIDLPIFVDDKPSKSEVRGNHHGQHKSDRESTLDQVPDAFRDAIQAMEWPEQN